MYAAARVPSLLAVLLTFLVPTVRSEVKTWVRNTNYGNPVNWQGSRVPCASDRAVFPASTQLAVLLPGGSTAVRELVLPLSGELLLPSNCRLAVTGKARSSRDCPLPSDVVFSRQLPAEWLLPGNWRVSGEGGGPATPHSYRVPCRHDAVHFPGDSSFSVRLPREPVYVRMLFVQGQEVSPAEWSDFLMTEAGERQFLAPEEGRQFAVTVTDEAECNDPTGCECVAETVEAEICRHQAASCGPPPPCFTPIKPLGHCCDVCGAYVLLDYDLHFRLADLEPSVAQMLKGERYSGLSYHVGKASTTGQIQVVLMDSGDYSSAPGDAAVQLVEMLENRKSLGVTRAVVYASGPASLADGAGRIAGSVFGPLLAVIVLLGLLYLIFVYMGDRRLLSFPTAGAGAFVFARFDNAPEEATEQKTAVEASDAAKVEVAVRRTEPSNAFDNPMFGKSSAAGSAGTRSQSRPPTQENPVFLELQKPDSSASEDTAEEELLSSEEDQDKEDV